jgi:tetratricopeptide (TPR) repeat protein
MAWRAASAMICSRRHAEAEPFYKRALAIDEKALRPNHPHVAVDLNNLARLYVRERRHAEAEPLYKRSLVINEKTFGPNHPTVATSLNDLGIFYSVQGRYADAERLFRRSLAIREKVFSPDHPDVKQSRDNLAELFRSVKSRRKTLACPPSPSGRGPFLFVMTSPPMAPY